VIRRMTNIKGFLPEGRTMKGVIIYFNCCEGKSGQKGIPNLSSELEPSCSREHIKKRERMNSV